MYWFVSETFAVEVAFKWRLPGLSTRTRWFFFETWPVRGFWRRELWNPVGVYERMYTFAWKALAHLPLWFKCWTWFYLEIWKTVKLKRSAFGHVKLVENYLCLPKAPSIIGRLRLFGHQSREPFKASTLAVGPRSPLGIPSFGVQNAPWGVLRVSWVGLQIDDLNIKTYKND